MPFIPNTPESLLGRSDSKDPSSTCRGITSNGRACRRSVARAAGGDKELYCWQHKDQACGSPHCTPLPQSIPEGRNNSLDTLADRIGLVNLQDGPQKHRPSRPKPKQQSLKCCFCFELPIDQIDENEPPPRPRPQPRPVQGATAASGPGARPSRVHVGPASPSKASRKSAAQRRTLALIPDSLEPLAASNIKAELARPYAEAEEAGFVYMFWLTPASKQAAAPVDAARSLLAPPPSPSSRSRRPSDVVSRFAAAQDARSASSPSCAPMLLKIGRAANVQRRMNQWQRQCGYDIEVLRFYPYLPSAGESSGQVPRMTPHCRRVERLIHLELAAMGLRANLGTCEACGREHREWFQVEASRDAIRSVDGVIRKWVQWDESNTR
ncbi:hypothetical protein CDD81_6218 [Ophiocordyceps australis]|uniref:Bacteriophage T5 Orf172 DNA-binding domain-containing protein n=1 Tax=Ophiocordyceps australis TaxID=1399860 RepID=A0A2C5Y397_9HYPO|nr:hypothetical protein CDD81_6218 [Ophiocordyceps australis]